MTRYDKWIRASDEAIDGSMTSVWLDMSNQYIGNLIKWDLYRCYIDFVREMFALCEWPPKAADIPIAFQEAVYGGNNPEFIHFAVPAILQLFEFYLPMMFTVAALITERRIGAMERGQVAGITLLETLVSHVLIQFTVLLVQTVIMMLVMFVMFDNPFHGSFILCSLLLFLIGVNGTCYGIFVGMFCHTDQSALYMGLGSFFPLAMLSGMIWPREGMHALLRSIAFLLPLTLTTESMRSILIRSWGITHPIVYNGFISVSSWILLFCFVTTVYIKYISKSLKVIS
ncbi:hypothetical protein AAG570_012293 [Ranatra chinensis]|uniref:ABC transmembrane type-2 domain-containing protein n=1 Tax=Ranatra chinensis TaxID=642074 RepID=A0ABD0YID4_9HEMI